MSGAHLASLAEQRRLLQEQLGTQRRVLARDLAAAGGSGGGYPRSITMRWLTREPELVARLIGRVAGGRIAASVPAVLGLVRFLRSTRVR